MGVLAWVFNLQENVLYPFGNIAFIPYANRYRSHLVYNQVRLATLNLYKVDRSYCLASLRHRSGYAFVMAVELVMFSHYSMAYANTFADTMQPRFTLSLHRPPLQFATTYISSGGFGRPGSYVLSNIGALKTLNAYLGGYFSECSSFTSKRKCLFL
jgi:hypothetical protein